MAIIDICTYNNEKELFEIRYNVLKDYVDRFVVVEFDKTFSGKPKGSSFPYKNWDKVFYFYVTEDIYKKYKNLAESSPNTQGPNHWKTEFGQKESIKDCLTDLENDDIVFIGDCDEIWNPRFLKCVGVFIGEKLPLEVYTYYLNNRSSEMFCGTLVEKYKNIKHNCLNHLRSNAPCPRKPLSMGWHFTSMAICLRQKLEDSYTEDSYANKTVMENLEVNIQSNKDFLGRDFTYRLDESQWPEYLVIHKEKYRHLLR